MSLCGSESYPRSYFSVLLQELTRNFWLIYQNLYKIICVYLPSLSCWKKKKKTNTSERNVFYFIGRGFCLCAINVVNSNVNTMKLITILIAKQWIYDLYDGCHNDPFLISSCIFIFFYKAKKNQIIISATYTWPRRDANFPFDKDKLLDVSVTTDLFSNW